MNKLEISNYLESRKVKLTFSIILTLLYFLLFARIAHPDMSDTAFFGGDSREYQSMGVNFAQGYGIQKDGGVEAFATYKLENVDSTGGTGFYKATVKDFYKNYGYNFYRTPVYPLFLGVVYKIVGISPYKAKLVQLLLLSIIAGFLPWIGYYFWRTKGFFSGLIASTLYIIKYYSTANNILTESLVAFVLFLILISYMYYETRKNTKSSIIFGVMLGIGLLTKGSLLFIPILLFIYFGIKFYRHRDKTSFKSLAIVISLFVLTILPWSLYASYNSESMVILSTQGSPALLDNNNEYCLDGSWHPEWRNLEKSFYKNDGMEDAAPSLRVLNFYKSHLGLFPKIMMNKIISGFSTSLYLWIIICLIIMEYYGSLIEKHIKNPLYYLIYVVFSVVSITFFVDYQFFVPLNMHLFSILLLLLFPLLIFLPKPLIKIPILFYIYLLNFFLITIITLGESRYIGVMNFIFILVAVHFVIEYFLKYLKGFVKNI